MNNWQVPEVSYISCESCKKKNNCEFYFYATSLAYFTSPLQQAILNVNKLTSWGKQIRDLQEYFYKLKMQPSIKTRK